MNNHDWVATELPLMAQWGGLWCPPHCYVEPNYDYDWDRPDSVVIKLRQFFAHTMQGVESKVFF
jgi:hypothetical protein